MLSKSAHCLAVTAALPILLLSLNGCQDEAPTSIRSTTEIPRADLVLRGGRIATVDPDIGFAEAIAVNDYTITAVGANSDIDRYVGEQTTVIELDGRLAIPGFIEGHGHYLSFGRAQQILDLTKATTWDEIVAQVAHAVDSAEAGAWINGRGWHQEKWLTVPEPNVDGVPLNDRLNVVAPANPVYLGHASGHAAFANDQALAAAGIDDQTANPDGGTIVRAANGRATGLLRENAQILVEAASDKSEAALGEEARTRTLRDQVRLAGDAALRYGITSFHDAGVPFETIDFFKQLETENALPVRLYVMVGDESNETMAANLARYRMLATANDFLTVRAIKKQIDGALGAHGAWLLEPYTDLPTTAGLVLQTVEDIEATAEIAAALGYQVNTHAIGTRANRETLDLYERAWQQADIVGGDLRWRIEHAQHIHPDDVPRFGALGVIAAMQGIHCTSDGPWIATRLGADRAKTTSYPWRDLLSTGAIIGNGTDVPVEAIDPIASYYASVSRITNTGTPFHPEHVMTRMEALRSYTINNAYAAFEEDIKGSLTPGKYADIVVLSQDILTIPDAELATTEIDYTIVGGDVKYRR